MAVPKKRTGHSAQGHRRSNWKATKPEVTTCSNCGETVLTHTVCTACGYYKGKPVSLKDAEKIEEEVKEEKKPAKKSTKKAKEEKVEEAPKAETTEVVEEKAEETSETKEDKE